MTEPEKRPLNKHTLVIGTKAMTALRELVELENYDHAKTLRAQCEIAIHRCLVANKAAAEGQRILEKEGGR